MELGMFKTTVQALADTKNKVQAIHSEYTECR
jgi:hypothetical protein